jgi:hypothetical protein
MNDCRLDRLDLRRQFSTRWRNADVAVLESWLAEWRRTDATPTFLGYVPGGDDAGARARREAGDLDPYPVGAWPHHGVKLRPDGWETYDEFAARCEIG